MTNATAPMTAQEVLSSDPNTQWELYAFKSGLLNADGIAPNPFQAQTAYYAFTAAWNVLAAAWQAEAAQTAPVVAGWVAVPIDATRKMIDAAESIDWKDSDVRGNCINQWNAMLAAAPSQPEQPTSDSGELPDLLGATPKKEGRFGGQEVAFRMDAYYYGFGTTGIKAIDLILSAVACAGKSYHHTESWNSDCGEPYHDLQRGKSPVEWIQNAADDAAEAIRAALAAIALKETKL